MRKIMESEFVDTKTLGDRPTITAEAFPPAAGIDSHQGKGSCSARICRPVVLSLINQSQHQDGPSCMNRVDRFQQRAEIPRAVDDMLHDDGGNIYALVPCATR